MNRLRREEHMSRGKLDRNGRTTIPVNVRDMLGMRSGDELVYVFGGERGWLARAEPHSANNPFALFEEWDSEADRAAYANL